MFVWRSNILGSSGKGHEYFLKYLLGTQNAVFGDEADAIKPSQVRYREEAAEGKLDLLTVLDFRMSTTCLYGDIVLPTATWYEKDDLNTSDMHPRSEEHTSELQSLMRTSCAVFCLKKKTNKATIISPTSKPKTIISNHE